MKKNITTLLILTLLVTKLFAAMPFFSGYAGLLTNLSLDENGEDFNPIVTTETFFNGQLDFSGVFILRGEFFLQTTDITNQNLFDDAFTENAFFKIEELSGTFFIKQAHSTSYINLFLGDFEPIGSDIFLRRQFGIQPISSPLTESWHSLSGASVYPFYGAGLSYTLHFEKPYALNFALYDNMQNDEEENLSIHTLNFDLRFATVQKNFTIDTCAGLAFPLESQDDTGTDVVLLVRRMQVHAGINMLLGNKSQFSLFTQAGFNKLTLSPSASEDDDTLNKLSFSDLYFLVEPRFNFRQFSLNFSIFNTPRDSAGDMLYLKRMVNANDDVLNLLGANITIYTDHLYLSNINATFGIHTTFAYIDSDLSQLESNIMSFMNWNYKLCITPYTEIPLLGGTFNAAFSMSIFDFMTNWKNAMLLTIGFKNQF